MAARDDIEARAKLGRQRAARKAQSGASRKAAGKGTRSNTPPGRKAATPTRAPTTAIPASLAALARSRVPLSPRVQAPAAAATTTPRLTPTTPAPAGRTGMAPGTNAPGVITNPVATARPVTGPNTTRVGAGQTSVTGRIPPANPPAQTARPSGQRLSATSAPTGLQPRVMGVGRPAPTSAPQTRLAAQVKTPLKPVRQPGLPALTRPSDPGAARLPLDAGKLPKRTAPAPASPGQKFPLTSGAPAPRQAIPVAARPGIAGMAGGAGGDVVGRPAAAPARAKPTGAGVRSNTDLAARSYGISGDTNTATDIREGGGRTTRTMTEQEIGRANLGKERAPTGVQATPVAKPLPKLDTGPAAMGATAAAQRTRDTGAMKSASDYASKAAAKASAENYGTALAKENAAKPAAAPKKGFKQSDNLFDWLAQ